MLLNYYDWQQTGDAGADGHCHEGAFMQTDEYCESSCNQAIKDGFKFLGAGDGEKYVGRFGSDAGLEDPEGITAS